MFWIDAGARRMPPLRGVRGTDLVGRYLDAYGGPVGVANERPDTTFCGARAFRVNSLAYYLPRGQ